MGVGVRPACRAPDRGRDALDSCRLTAEERVFPPEPTAESARGGERRPVVGEAGPSWEGRKARVDWPASWLSERSRMGPERRRPRFEVPEEWRAPPGSVWPARSGLSVEGRVVRD